MKLLQERIAYKPFEYPIFEKFTNLIRKTYWIHQELSFNDDVHQFKTSLDDNEKYIIGTILKTFAQTETVVADEFWGILGEYIKKPEFIAMCATFTENEFRHADAYAELNVKLGLDNFEEFLEDKVSMQRLDNLTKIKKSHGGKPDVGDLARTLAIFGGFTENVNLFSQFAILLSFSQRGLLDDIGNIIAWSQKDEAIHAQAAIYTFKVLLEENPEFNTEELEKDIKDAAKICFDIESNILNQIFKNGDLPNLTKEELLNFMKDRINQSLSLMGYSHMYEIDKSLLMNMQWFYDEAYGLEHTDFFHSRPVEYSKGVAEYSTNKLF